MAKKTKKAEVKFPFEPNETSKQAFRQEIQLKRAVSIMTEAITKVAADVIDPWEILKREHPELRKEFGRLRYNQISETVGLAEWQRLPKEKL